jgi:hypothetical protein
MSIQLGPAALATFNARHGVIDELVAIRNDRSEGARGHWITRRVAPDSIERRRIQALIVRLMYDGPIRTKCAEVRPQPRLPLG